MNLKSIAKGLLALNVVAVITTSAAAWLLDRRSVTDLLDIATYVGLGMGALGGLMFAGSSAGSSTSTGMAASASDQPSRIMDALWMDRNAGISAGAMFVVSGLIWLGIAWFIAVLIG